MRLSEKEIIARLQGMSTQFGPVVLISIQKDAAIEDGLRADARIQFQIPGGPSFEALAEIASVASPKNIRAKCMQLLDLVRKTGNPNLTPLLIAPYVPAKQAEALAEAGVSWLDLSGNMVLRASDRVYIERTGRPNQFPDTAPIKKVFEGTASLVVRALLLQPAGFASLRELVDFINSRSASITVSTVSKVLNSLENDLLISKEGSRIRAVDPSQLLDRLAEGYASSFRKRRSNVYRFAVESVEQVRRTVRSMPESAYIFCGFYAAELKGLAASTQITMYAGDVSRVQQISDSLLPDEDFGQLSIIEAKDRTPWFNAETVDGVRVVDDIELYLEMTIDTPRGPKVANILRPRILREATYG
jgi:hypothetical protein